MLLSNHAYSTAEFGRFRLVPRRRELFVDGGAVHVGSRAFDVLMALVEAKGELRTKGEILDRVWGAAAVEENNLQAHISTLRKLLGKDRDFIRTITGRGYRFVADVTFLADGRENGPSYLSTLGVQRLQERARTQSPSVAADWPAPATNLPAAASDLIGREADLSRAEDLLAEHRLLTLIGAGGVGKTQLALEVGRNVAPKFSDGVSLAELGPLSTPELVPITVGRALGLDLGAGGISLQYLTAALRSKHMLVLLDNCEHVIEAVAELAAALLRVGSSIRVLATSREPLRVGGECTYRVPSLEAPPEDALDTDAVLRSGAVRLFLARARAADPRFSQDPPKAATMATICRRLDGVPLAIEFAASRVATLGIDVVASRLDDRFKLLTGGRRTELAQHQGLRATLDWSYGLLSEIERIVLRRLAIFAGSFALEQAAVIAATANLSTPEVTECVSNLVEKSLVTAISGTVVRYRLPETTRAYALEKLHESGEYATVARRHAKVNAKPRLRRGWSARGAGRIAANFDGADTRNRRCLEERPALAEPRGADQRADESYFAQ
jgi:predicted ATPase